MKINIVTLFFLCVFFNFNLSSETYLIKIKENTNQFQNKKVIDKVKNKVRLLNAEQESLFSELEKYYLLDDNELEQINSDYEIVPNYKYRIEQDISPNDAQFTSQWEMQVINALDAWRFSTGEGIIIGLIDTGIDYSHPDLVNSLWINEKEDINGNGRFDDWASDEERDGIFGDLDGIDQDGNGYADDVIGYDFVSQEYANFGDWTNPDPIPFDEGEHGTSVAGVMVAEANDIGIRGLAYNSKLLSVRCFDGAGEAESDDIARSIIYAVLNGAKVLNFSFGEPYSSPILRDAIKFAFSMGVVMIASSGNNGWTRPHFPSDYSEVISVGGSTSENTIYGFSNFGSYVDIVAPGNQVLSTEAFNQGYSRSNGTSMAAPFISATAALLLSNNKNLKPTEIRSLIQTTAFDLGNKGWDNLFGAGLLDVSKAVRSSNVANFDIVYPKYDDLFIRNIDNQIPISISTTIPLFDSWQLMLAKGHFPDNITEKDKEEIAKKLELTENEIQFYSDEELLSYKWQLIDSSNKSIKNEFATNLDINDLDDTTYTIRLLIKTKNNSTIERRTKIRITNNINKLRFLTHKIASAIDKGEKVYYFAGKTNFDCDVKIEAINKSSNDTNYFSNTNYGGQYHYIKLHNLLDGEYQFKIYGVTNNKDSAKASITEQIKSYKFDKNSFSKKEYSFRRSYQLNKVANFTSDNPQFIINDLTNLEIGKTIMLEFDGEKFNEIDSSSNAYIPIDYSDFNGDGNVDLLTSTSNEVEVFFNSNSILSNSVFKNSLETLEWADDTYDFDSDGRAEILINIYNDKTQVNEFAIRKYQNNTFEITDTLFPPYEASLIGFERGGIVEDFDNDGKPEVIAASRFGTLHIYEYDGAQFNNVENILEQVSLSRQFLSKYTFPDGTKGFLSLNYGDSEMFSERGSGRAIWTARLFISEGDNKFALFWKQQFHGVRDGLFGLFPVSYKNGITSGELDNNPGEEIIISVFPNLYIYTFNESTLIPLYHNDDAITNTTMIYDFDENGKNDIAISTGNGTELFEYKENEIPNLYITDAYAVDSTTAFIEWQTNPNIDGVEIFKLVNDEVEFIADIDIINSATITNLTPFSYHFFTAVAYKNISGNKVYGNPLNFSDIIEIYTHNKFGAKEIINYSNNSINVKFNGDLPEVEIESKYFTLLNENISFSPSKVLTNQDSTAILVFSDSIPEGEYKLEIKSFRDLYSTPTLSSNFDFSMVYEEIEEMYLKSLEIQGISLLSIEFSEEVGEGANNPSNYIMRPAGVVFSVGIIPGDSSKVQLNIDRNTSDAIGKDYTIQVVNVYSKTGKPITQGPGSVLAFTYSASSIENAFVYPNPISLKKHSEATIANLTETSDVYVFNEKGNLLRILQERDGNGGVQWDLKDSNGNILKSGIYFYKIIGIEENGLQVESKMFKFAVIP